VKKVRPSIDAERFIGLLEEKAFHSFPLASIIGQVRSDGTEVEIRLALIRIEEADECQGICLSE
jgi:hypothetical protein